MTNVEEKAPMPTGTLTRGGSRDVRSLPFSRETFTLIAQKLHVHGSIAKAISRADASSFSGERICMGDDAYGESFQVDAEENS